MPGKLDGKVAVVTGAGLGIGFIITERKQQPEMAEMVNATVQQIPMRRGGEPMDIAHLMLFLASAEAAYIT